MVDELNSASLTLGIYFGAREVFRRSRSMRKVIGKVFRFDFLDLLTSTLIT